MMIEIKNILRCFKAGFFQTLALLGLLFPFPSMAVQITCEYKDQFKPEFDQAQLGSCNQANPNQCLIPAKSVIETSGKLNEQLKKICESVTELNGDIQDIASQRKPQEVIAGFYSQLKRRYEDYVKNLKDAELKTRQVMLQANGPLIGSLAVGQNVMAVNDRKILEKTFNRKILEKNSETAIENLYIKQARNFNEAENDDTLFASRNGMIFMKKLLAERKKAEKTISDLQLNIDQARANAENSGPSSTETKSGKEEAKPSARNESSLLGGLDLKSIAALATAGVGLASAMKKQDNSANGAGGATSPTPNSTNTGNSSPASSPSSSKFGIDGKSAPAPSLNLPGKEKKTETPILALPNGTSFRSNSDISKTNDGNSLSGTKFTPANGKVSGGGGGASGGDSARGGDANSKQDSNAKGASDHKEEENLQGIGGGALGGGFGGGGGAMGGALGSVLGGAPPALGGEFSSQDPSAAPPDSMKDLLNNMTEAAAGSADAATQDGTVDLLGGPEDIFGRVRACHVRLLRQGRVLNGLGDRLPE